MVCSNEKLVSTLQKLGQTETKLGNNTPKLNCAGVNKPNGPLGLSKGENNKPMGPTGSLNQILLILAQQSKSRIHI